jgi:ABC-type sugar transport system ATPase subunit
MEASVRRSRGTSVDRPLIRIDGVSKSFGGVNALSDVTFEIRPGVVHGLVGANGAGKSTLIRCLAGVGTPDSGRIEVDGEVVAIDNPDDATTLGLAFIHQEMSLIPGWDVLRNMALGITPTTHLGVIDWRPTGQRAREVADLLGFGFGLLTNVDTLSTADQWLVLIGRALMHDARLIAMDEPTASLSAVEAERLHAIIRDLAAKGTAVLFVSHRLDEVSDLCQDITVFKDGAVTKRVVGAGRTELAKIIYGAARATSGEVWLDGAKTRFRHPVDAVRAGIGLVPEERRSEGLFLDRTIDFNINIAGVDSLVRSRLWPLLRLGEARRRAQRVADLVSVKASDVGQIVGSLSGGNQQKVVIARWLVNPPRLLILDEPSRGVDVGARAEVHQVVRELASRGTAVLAISSDNEELVGLCDRVVVMTEGRVTGELTGASITIDHIVHRSFGHEKEKEVQS